MLLSTSRHLALVTHPSLLLPAAACGIQTLRSYIKWA